MEKLHQRRRTFFLPDAAYYLYFRVEVTDEIHHGAAGPGLGLVGSEDYRANPAGEDRTCTHCAGLKGDRQCALLQVPGVPVGGGRLPDGKYLRVGGGIMPEFFFVAGGGDEVAVGVEDGGCDGDVDRRTTTQRLQRNTNPVLRT